MEFCRFCNQQATYIDHLGRLVCDKHADQCARIGIVVQEIKSVPKPVQADRAY